MYLFFFFSWNKASYEASETWNSAFSVAGIKFILQSDKKKDESGPNFKLVFFCEKMFSL